MVSRITVGILSWHPPLWFSTVLTVFCNKTILSYWSSPSAQPPEECASVLCGRVWVKSVNIRAGKHPYHRDIRLHIVSDSEYCYIVIWECKALSPPGFKSCIAVNWWHFLNTSDCSACTYTCLYPLSNYIHNPDDYWARIRVISFISVDNDCQGFVDSVFNISLICPLCKCWYN